MFRFRLVTVVCIIFLSSAVLIPLTRADWPIYRSNSSRTGVGTGSIETVPTVLWKSNITFQTGYFGHTWTTPAVVNGVVYICSSSYQVIGLRYVYWYDVYAFNAINGTEIWDYRIDSSEETRGEISNPAVVNGVVYFGTDENKVYALSASNGVLLWNSSIPNNGHSSPAVIDSVVYIGGGNNVYALNSVNGDIIWNSTVGDYTALSSPAVVNGVVYIGSVVYPPEPTGYYPGNVYALNATDGSQLWESDTNGWVMASPAVANDVVYASSYDGNIYALNANTGAKLWNSHNLSSNPTSPPAVANGFVYFDSSDGNVYALNAATGAKVWSFISGTGTGTPPIVADGIVITVRPSGIYGLNAEKGAIVWNLTMVNNAYGEPAVDNGIMYFGAGDDQVYALGSAGASPEPSNTLLIVISVLVVVVIVAIVISLIFRKLKTQPKNLTPKQ